MDTEHAILALLEDAEGHGYELKRMYDERFDDAPSLSFGTIYRLLARLVESGQVMIVGTEPGSGPDRKKYAVTDAGVAELERWLTDTEEPRALIQEALVTKVVLSLASRRTAGEFLRRQRQRHLATMRDLTRRRREADATTAIRIDYQLFHLEADLRWIDLVEAREETS